MIGLKMRFIFIFFFVKNPSEPSLGALSLKTLPKDYATNTHMLFQYQQFVER